MSKAAARRSSLPVPAEPNESRMPAELREMLRSYLQSDDAKDVMRKEVRRLSSRTMPAQRNVRWGPLQENEISLQMDVAVKVGSGQYIPGRVVDIAQTQVGGYKLFVVDRLDGVKKELGAKKADHIYPVERAPSPKSAE